MHPTETSTVPEFDLVRLASEIDNLFQNTLIAKQNDFDKNISQTSDEWKVELQALLIAHKALAREAVESLRDKMIVEIERGRVTIVLSPTREFNVQHMDHPEMANVVTSLHTQKKAMLVGPAGTGKTYMVADIAKRLNVKFYKYSCSRDSSVHDLLGYKQPSSETYLETTFLKAYENGGVFLVDEYDAMSGDMSLFFNGIADNSDFISIPHRDTKPTAKKHKDFHLVMCGNTWGKGSTDYSGRDFQDMALMDRFRFCRHHIGYHFELEKTFAEDMVSHKLIEDLRRGLERIGSYLSTRNVEDIFKLRRNGIPFSVILKAVFQDLTIEEAEAVLGGIQMPEENLGRFSTVAPDSSSSALYRIQRGQRV